MLKFSYKKTKMRFFLFFTLSALLHSLVFACVRVFFEEPLLKTHHPEAPLALDIRTFTIHESNPSKRKEVLGKNVEQTPKPLPISKPKAIQKQVVAPIKEPHKKAEVLLKDEAKTLQPDAFEQPLVNTVEPLHVNAPSNQQEEITDAIQQAILRYKQYPKRAQRDGIQGDVIVHFSWSSLGLTHLKILKPSAYALLNEYCLELIEHASKDFPKVEQNVDITIPIGFKLL